MLVKAVTKFYKRETQLLNTLNAIPFHIKDEWRPVIQELSAYHERLVGNAELLNTFVHFKEEDAVYWLELKGYRDNPWVYLNISPLNITDLLCEYFFSVKESVILTSATLTINNNFAFFKNELGLQKLPSKQLIETILPSPFNYKEQMSICIPTDIPLPQDVQFTPEVVDLLIEILEITQGKTFILFTSYSMLNYAYNQIQQHFDHRMTLLKQGSSDRHTLINQFKNGNQSVLFGTDSFWEGVDVPGNNLRCVILIKLPFKVPTEPITQGKMEKLEQEGKNPFFDYSLPQSVIKFKQGFGRLIRTDDDRGVVICLDKRIVTKSYGQLFLNSLPSCNQVVGSSVDMLNEVHKYF